MIMQNEGKIWKGQGVKHSPFAPDYTPSFAAEMKCHLIRASIKLTNHLISWNL
jgi:hypothetical protein